VSIARIVWLIRVWAAGTGKISNNCALRLWRKRMNCRKRPV
jgi:hypothetical protein